MMKAVKNALKQVVALCSWLVSSGIRVAVLLVVLTAVFGAVVLYAEDKHSPLQSRLFTHLSKDVSWEVRDGQATEVVFPKSGPFNKRRGYTLLPEFLSNLQDDGYVIEQQSQPSAAFLNLQKNGYVPPHDYTTQTGLSVRAQEGDVIYKTAYPVHVYSSYEEIPDLVKQTLFFIEDRSMLENHHPQRSPVVEWDRLALAGKDYTLDKLGMTRNVPGASTLITQYFKFTHANKGQTNGIRDKWRQMYSASLFAYRNGATPDDQMKKVVLHYINHIPLSGQKNWGSVHGLGDALHAFYGLKFDKINDLLRDPKGDVDTALALRHVASVFVAQRRPTHLFHADTERRAYVNLYLKQMYEEGFISRDLYYLALETPVSVLDEAPNSIPIERETKLADSIRYELAKKLGDNDNLMSLDRLDIDVKTTVNMDAQRAIRKVLAEHMVDPQYLDDNGFRKERLLKDGDPKQLTYSFTLYERLPGRNVLRAQIDTSPKSLNINESTRLDLGSTSKLRTLITYLQTMSDIYTKLGTLSRNELLEVEVKPGDRLTYWARGHLFMRRASSRLEFLNDAMDRKYRASPYQAFLTSGGMHRFHNFNDRFDKRRMTLWSGTRSSVNLVFVRLMQDIVRHHRFDKVDAGILKDINHPSRKAYLTRWAKRDLSKHFSRKWAKWASTPSSALKDRISMQLAAEPHKLASVLTMLKPRITKAQLSEQIKKYSRDSEFDEERFVANEAIWDLGDRAYVTKMHPIELWLLKKRWDDPRLSKEDALKLAQENIEVFYTWLFERPSLGRQNKFIRIELERDAFDAIHKQWKSMGYPFEDMTPSLATALGASGDRPNALAKMMGILINDGKLLDEQRIEQISFADNTPYETHLHQRSFGAPVKVLDPEVAMVARKAAQIVVRRGTARRANHALGEHVNIGGKTGTGDHRLEKLDKWGRVISSKGIRRSGSFAFFMDKRFYGVMTVYTDKNVDQYDFTSGLTVKIFKQLGPILSNLYRQSDSCDRDSKCMLSRQDQKNYVETMASLNTILDPAWNFMSESLEDNSSLTLLDATFEPFDTWTDEVSIEQPDNTWTVQEDVNPVEDAISAVKTMSKILD